MAARKTPPKSKAKAAVLATAAAYVPGYENLLDGIDRKFKLGQGSMSLEARLSSTVSTGLLGSDLMLGGGTVSGRWNTFFGGEGSAKSTHIAHIKLAAADAGIPVLSDFDYEGSSDPQYYTGIMEYHSKIKTVAELFGVQDPTNGKWVVPRRVRYNSVVTAEDFFNATASFLRRIPDKEYIEDKWWYSWDATKEGRAAAGNKYSAAMFRRYKRLMIEAENGMPQAMFFLDSYPAMYPEKLDEDDKGLGMAAVARAMAENIPKIASKLRSKGVIINGVNQLRLRPAVQYGNPEYEPGGEALKFVSSVRVRQAARSVPHGKGPIEEEPSAIYEGATDSYRYIHMKAIKNKAGTPYLESWQRIWINDGTGTAHGFDPVWDTFQYLKNTGQLEQGSTMKKLKIPMLGIKQAVTWDTFKQLILLEGKPLKQACGEIGITKPLKLREKCKAQMKTGEGMKLYFANMLSDAGNEDEDESDDDESDED